VDNKKRSIGAFDRLSPSVAALDRLLGAPGRSLFLDDVKEPAAVAIFGT